MWDVLQTGAFTVLKRNADVCRSLPEQHNSNKNTLSITSHRYPSLYQLGMALYVSNRNMLLYFQRLFEIIIVLIALDNRIV